MVKPLTQELLDELKAKAARSRGDIVAMTHLASSGHPGGSMSSIDIYTVLAHVIDLDRDQVVISHGHTSPGVYSALARRGLFDPLLPIKGYRRVGSAFAGHVEPEVPGITWGTGNLGQGLSVAAGQAIAARLKGEEMDSFVIMGDGEQQKGQIVEARRFINKYALTNITVIVDDNRLQISGNRDDVMPQDLRAEYEATGFAVLEIDGHDLSAIQEALVTATGDKSKPYAILARTIMGKGVSFMENKEKYHGSPLNAEQMEQAIKEVKLEWPLETLRAMRQEPLDENLPAHAWKFPEMKTGEARDYSDAAKTDNRSAFGNALLEVGQANPDKPMAVFDCDLAGSVKTGAFAKAFPEKFFQAGIAEHNAVVMAGAASTQEVVSIFADFGMFGIDETYNQQRLNAVNEANIKLFCTHIGIDVGEDGKTHQCIDYLGLTRNLPDFKVIIPCDPNETDRATRWALTTPGNCLVGMGRSKLDILTDEDGQPIVNGKGFEYGKAHHLRNGEDATVFALGAMSANAVAACALLKENGINVSVVGVSCPFALDVSEIKEAAERGPVFVVEDHLSVSGLANQIAYTAATTGIAISLVSLGVDGFPPSGPSQMCAECFGLDPAGIAESISCTLKE